MKTTLAAVPSLPDACPLTRQEMRVLRQLAEGLTYAQIAERLGCQTSTVRTHLHAAYNRLGVATSYQAVLACARAGWLGLDDAGDAGCEQMLRLEALLGRLVDAHVSRRKFRTLTPAQHHYLDTLDLYLTDRRRGHRHQMAGDRMRSALSGVLAEAGIASRHANEQPERDLVDDLLSLTQKAARAA